MRRIAHSPLPVPRLLVTAVSLFSASLLASGCGGSQGPSTTPDESGDLEVTTNHGPAVMPPGIDGSTWRWVEAHCTEGPLDLLGRGYAASVHVEQHDNVVRLVTDQQFATEQCQHTLVTDATLPASGGSEWQMEEVARVAVPSTRECFARPEEPRPGSVLINDGRLEVFVQRSQWCNGLEVRMVYERAPEALLTEEQIIRRYIAHFSRGDADAVARLFAESGSLLEPFTQTETGDPYRHDGRARVQRWFAETFATAPWRAMRITDVAESGEAGQRSVTWEYMDPRLSQPLIGRTRFMMAAGEIFEAAIELEGEPQLVEPAAEAAEAEATEADAAAPPAD